MLARWFSILGIFFFLFASAMKPYYCPSVTEDIDLIVNEAMLPSEPQAADDLMDELRRLLRNYLDDPDQEFGVGYSFTHTAPVLIHFRGTTITTLAYLIPLLSSAQDSQLKNDLIEHLRYQVENYLLNLEYWRWEHSSEDFPDNLYLSATNPNIDFGWGHRYLSGPHWEKMYAFWAYAFYTDDWQLIEDNWDFIRERYTEGYKEPDKFQRTIMITTFPSIYRISTNDLASGLIGYTRLAEYMEDESRFEARNYAHKALNKVLSELNVPWNACPVNENWDANPNVIRGEWTPGNNLTPELGRWVQMRAKVIARYRLNQAVNSGALKGLWMAGYVNNGWKGVQSFPEDVWGMPNFSHQLFLGLTWMLNEPC